MHSQDRKASRRDFLKTTTVAAAGSTMIANLSMLSNVHAGGVDPIRVGLIGCGGRGSGAAGDVLRSAPNVEIYAIGDAFKFRVDGLKRRLADMGKEDEVQTLGNRINLTDDRCFAGVDAYQKVIDSGADYIILATPPGFRPIHIQAAVAARKHFFTEKPVAVDGPGIRKVLAAYEDALKANLCIAAGTQRRHEAAYLETIERVHNGEIGDITAMRCYWNQGPIWFRKRDELSRFGEKVNDLAYHLHNWYHFVWTCGDHIVEQHVHNLDVCNWAIQKHPTRAVGMGSRIGRTHENPKENGHIFDNFAVDFEYDNGVHMLSMCRQIPGCENSVSEAIQGSKGFCQADRSMINGKRVAQKAVKRSPYVQEHTDLINAIRSGKPLNELKTVAESTLTAIMGRMTAYTGKAVTWDKALNSQLDTMPKNLSWDMTIDVPEVAIPGKTPLV